MTSNIIQSLENQHSLNYKSIKYKIMRKVLFLSLIGLMSSFSVPFTDDDKSAITKVINEFSIAGDQNDVSSLSVLLNEHYRITMNQLFGSTEISVMNKTTYLEMIDQKKFGGDKRAIEIISIEVLGNNAFAHVHLKGVKANFNSVFGLVKTADKKWQLISDTISMLE